MNCSILHVNHLFGAMMLSFATMTSVVHVEAQTYSAAARVDTKTVYQHIDGFGGTGMNGQWADRYTKLKVYRLWGKGESYMNYNIMRVRINPNQGNWGEYGNPIIWGRTANPDLVVFATPWTPPKKFKTSKTTKYKNEFGTDVWPLVEHAWGGEGSNGGEMNSDYIEQYATFLNNYRKTMISKGCPIDIISIQNECDYTPTATDGGVEHASYESCIFSPNQMAAMVKALKAKVPEDFKVMGPECFGWGQHGFNNKLVSIPDAVENIDIWGNHIYGINDWSYINKITAKTGKPMWMTEFSVDNRTGKWTEEYGFIDNVETTLANGFSAYVYYNMLNEFFGDGTSDNKNESSNTLHKRAYVFGHYARYATGKWRTKIIITDNNSQKITGSAYTSVTGDTISVFLLNRSNYEYKISVMLPDTMTQVRQAVTNQNENRVITDVTAQYGGSKRPSLILKPASFYTFEFIRQADPSAISTPKPESVGDSRVYDLSGREIPSLRQAGRGSVIIRDGKKYLKR